MSAEPEKKYRPNVAIIVTDGQGRVLLCKRLHPTFGANADIQTVQGGIDKGETPSQAAARELKEELGLKDGQFQMIGEMPTPYKYDWPQEYLASLRVIKHIGQEQHFFLAQVEADVPMDLEVHEREFSEVRWGKPQELMEQIWAPKRTGTEAALRYFGLI